MGTFTSSARSFHEFARDLLAVLDEQNVEQAVFSGLSMGGQVVMELARCARPRLRGALFAACSAGAESAQGRAARHEMAARLVREGMVPYADEVLPRMLGAEARLRQPAVCALVRTMMHETAPEGAAAALRARADRPDYHASLAELDVPVRVVVGDEDAFTSRHDVDALLASLRHGRLDWLDGVGHMPNLEAPERFDLALHALLREV